MNIFAVELAQDFELLREDGALLAALAAGGFEETDMTGALRALFYTAMLFLVSLNTATS